MLFKLQRNNQRVCKLVIYNCRLFSSNDGTNSSKPGGKFNFEKFQEERAKEKAKRKAKQDAERQKYHKQKNFNQNDQAG